MSILITIIMFGIIIALHEFGHFIVAKLCDVRIAEFSIGVGPAIFKKKGKETLFCIRLLPFGGFCMFENDEDAEYDERAFENKKTWQKIVILLAGALMNILLGFILVFVTTCLEPGKITSTTVSNFYENARSEQTGLKVDDRIIEVNGMRVFVDGDILYQFSKDKDGVFDMAVMRDGEKVELEGVTFDLIADESGNSSMVIDFTVYGKDKTFVNICERTVNQTIYISRIVILSLVDLVSGEYSVRDLSGPVGVVSVIGSAISPQQAFINNVITVLTISSLITVNVGIFNLIPFPALDGGKILFRIIEVIIKKKIKPEIEGTISAIGMFLLFGLMIFTTFNDILKLFGK